MSGVADLLQYRRRRQQIEHGGIPHELPAVTDRELEATLVRHGQPAWSARELRTNPQARFLALRFWCDVRDAEEGDRQAKQRVDFMREQWVALRREELIADNPLRQHTELVDPSTLL